MEALHVVVTKIRNGTERNGTVPPTKIRNARNGTSGTAQCIMRSRSCMVRKRLGTSYIYNFRELPRSRESDP